MPIPQSPKVQTTGSARHLSVYVSVLETAVLAPTSNMSLRVGDPDGVQEEHKRFILVWAEECPTFSGDGETCIILHRSACSRGYKRVREGGAPRS
jgi:hypothetical protein